MQVLVKEARMSGQENLTPGDNPEAGGPRRSVRVMKYKEAQMEIGRKDLTDNQCKKERIKLDCPVLECTFSTDYVLPEIAIKQKQEHWEMKHRDDYIAEEIRIKQEEQDAYIAIEEQKHKKTKEWMKELETLELEKQMKLEIIRRGELKVKLDADGKMTEIQQVNPSVVN